MAELPNYQEKQRYLFAEKVAPETLKQLAGQFLSAGALTDALDFFERAQDLSGIEQIFQQAKREGDLFIAEKSAASLKRPLTQSDYREIAETAERLGKLSFAKLAAEKSGKVS